MAKADLTVARVRELLEYDPETGQILWRTTGKGRRPNRVAGTIGPQGYSFIIVDRGRWRAHRLAWAYMHGAFPVQDIDHINGDRADNRIANLREVSNRVNSQNRRRPGSDNKSGYLGVSWKTRLGRWIAVIQVDGRHKHLGSFATPEEASATYIAAKRQFHIGCTL
jgi:hypothetical protein